MSTSFVTYIVPGLKIINLAPIILLVSVYSLSYSQVYQFKLYTTATGLSSPGAETLYQDSEGYLWIGTYNGLNRYDGVSFRQFLNSGSEASRVKCFYEDGAGLFWIGTEGNGIARMHQQAEALEWWKSTGTSLPSDSVYTFLRDRQGNLWIGTANGVLVLTPDSTTHHFTTRDGLPHHWVNQIVQQENSTVWIATNRGVISCRFNASRLTDVVLRTSRRALTVLAAKDQSVYVGTAEGPSGKEGGVLRFMESQGDTILSYAREGRVLKVMSLAEDSSGIIWIGTNSGVYFVEGKTAGRMSKANGLPHDYVMRVMVDREGSLWMGTSEGAIRFARKYVMFWDFEGLRRILVSSDGVIWFGGYGSLLRFDPKKPVVPFAPLERMVAWNVHALAEDANEWIWIGTAEGLTVFKGDHFEDPAIERLPSRAYNSMVFIPGGGKWLSGGGKIYLVQKGRVTKVYNRQDGIPPYGPDLMVDRKGRVWFYTFTGGVGYITPDSHAVRIVHDLPDPRVYYLFEDSRDVLWISTASGIYVLKENRFREFRSGWPALDDSRVNWIFEDRFGAVWFCSTAGIFGWRDTVFVQFDRHDGVLGGSVNCGAEDAEGNLWFGTNDGIVCIPRRVLEYPIPVPHVSVERTEDGPTYRQLPLEKQYSDDEDNFLFRFRSLSFFDEENMEFRWRLEGIEDHWNEERNRRTVRHAKLPPGSYTLHVIARNRGGAWSSPATYEFEILPPYWQTWWFLSSVLLLAVGIAYGVYRYRLAQVLTVERLRARIAADLHDDVGSNLSSIALASQLIARKIRLPETERSQLVEISSIALQTSDMMKDIVWLLNPKNDSLDDLLLKMKAVAENMLRNIPYGFTSPTNRRLERIDLEVKRNLFLMYKEILNNIVKHSSATAVTIVVRLENRTLSLDIQDNGKGFDMTNRSTGNGLENLRKRSEQIGAGFSMQSRPGEGTAISLTVEIT